MLKLCSAGILGSGLLCIMAVAASAHMPPPGPPPIYDELPPPLAGRPAAPLYEGRSMYWSEDPSRFPGHVDEKGYQSGMPENPQF